MKRSKHIIAFLFAVTICSALLGGCGSNPAAGTGKESGWVTAELQNDGSLLIRTAGLTSEVTFIDVRSGDTAMQLLIRKGGDGTARLSWNTCRVCNGSPYAYFEVEDGKLVCRNCGNKFSLDSVGGSSGGCYPLPVDGSIVSGGTVTIPAQTLQAAEPFFANWKKGI